MTGYTYSMRIYFGKYKQNATQTMATAHTTVRRFSRRVGVGHKPYMNNFLLFFSIFI
jgi:hypothetical protein